LRKQQGVVAVVENRLADVVKRLEQLCTEVDMSQQECQTIADSHQASTTIAAHIETFIDEASLPGGLEDFLLFGTANGLQFLRGMHENGDDADNSLTFSRALQLVSTKAKFYEKESTRKTAIYEAMKLRVDSLLVLPHERSKNEIYSALERMETPGTNIRIVREAILIKKLHSIASVSAGA
jgi:hypothetical protein